MAIHWKAVEQYFTTVLFSILHSDELSKIVITGLMKYIVTPAI